MEKLRSSFHILRNFISRFADDTIFYSLQTPLFGARLGEALVGPHLHLPPSPPANMQAVNAEFLIFKRVFNLSRLTAPRLHSPIPTPHPQPPSSHLQICVIKWTAPVNSVPRSVDFSTLVLILEKKSATMLICALI